MEEKERIIELIRQEVLTLEEGLELLENLDATTTKAKLDAELEADAQASQALKEEWDQQAHTTKNLDEELTICRQRLRELEILEELDDLSEQMLDKKAELQAEIKELEAAIEASADEEASLKAAYQEAKDSFTQAAGQAAEFGEEAMDGLQSLFQGLKEFGTKFGRHFQKKEVNLNFKVPSFKTQTGSYQKQLAGKKLQGLKVNLFNGDLNVKVHDRDRIELDLSYTLYGEAATSLDQVVEELVTFEVEDGVLTYQATSPRIATMANLYLPKEAVDEVVVQLTNGDLGFYDLECERIDLDSRNGEIKLSNIKAQKAEIESFIGDVEVTSSWIEAMDYHNISGDYRQVGYVGDLRTEVITGDVSLTKLDAYTSHIEVDNTTGDLKLAVPNALAVDAAFKSRSGSLQSRLEGEVEVMETHQAQRVRRQEAASSNYVEVKAKITYGSFYLKDSQKGQEV